MSAWRKHMVLDTEQRIAPPSDTWRCVTRYLHKFHAVLRYKRYSISAYLIPIDVIFGRGVLKVILFSCRTRSSLYKFQADLASNLIIKLWEQFEGQWCFTCSILVLQDRCCRWKGQKSGRNFWIFIYKMKQREQKCSASTNPLLFSLLGNSGTHAYQ